MSKQIYLDYAATTPVDPEVQRAMRPFFDTWYGNPSSLYNLGQKSKQAVSDSRQKIAAIISCQPDEIIFTGSGTASINLALKGLLKKGEHLIISVIEHPAVIDTAHYLQTMGIKLTIVPVNKDGQIDVQKVLRSIQKNTRLVSVMYANNEIGTVQPIQKLGSAIEKLNRYKKTNIFFHTDACQAAGALDIDVRKLHVHMMTINAGKIYGPKGVGMLYVRRQTSLATLLHGGGQEKKLYSGTENVPGIVGLAKALELADRRRTKESKRLITLRDWTIREVLQKIPQTYLNGDPTNRLPNNISFSFDGIEGESLVYYLDKKGIQASVGSACSSLDSEYSHVIGALGKNKKYIASTIRLTLGKFTTRTDMVYTVKTLVQIIKHLRESGKMLKN